MKIPGQISVAINNLLIDRARRGRREIELLPIIEAPLAPRCAEQEHGIEADELQVVIDRTLAELPPRTRRVFMMQRFGGMSYREIEAALGISRATVEYHMMRALRRLREAIDLPDRRSTRVCQRGNPQK